MGKDSPAKVPELPKLDSWDPFSSDGHPFANLTELADPFGIDPVGRGLHGLVAGALDPYHEGPELNEQLSQLPAPNGGVQRPTKEAANITALQEAKNSLKRRSASRTLFTGGQGLSDSPTASNLLLGS